MSLFTPPNGPPKTEMGVKVLTVSSLLRLVKTYLEKNHHNIWVEGEIADFVRARSGHLYFTLRDEKEDAALRAVMWSSDAQRLRFKPKEGIRVRAKGTLTLYEARGTFQMRAVRLEPTGEGDLQRRFEEIRGRLAALGLLDPARKRPLPQTPQRVGIVTSRDGAALRDILKVLATRIPVAVLLSHAAVQGESAPNEIIAALQRLANVADIEVVIVGRGGGSADDLWAWNDEKVALAIAQHRVPVISAVGHETDITIADLVADRRAATPSEAAMLVTPDREDIRRFIINQQRRLVRAMQQDIWVRQTNIRGLRHRLPEPWQLVDGPRQKLDDLLRKTERHIGDQLRAKRQSFHLFEIRLARLQPGESIKQARHELATLQGRLGACTSMELEKARARLTNNAAALDALSPLNTLRRGYGVVTCAQKRAPITHASDVVAGSEVTVELEQGSLQCRVNRVRKNGRESDTDQP